MRGDPLSLLFGLEQFGIKFGLDNMHKMVEALGHPERSFKSVHIAGTNGKGSVTAMVDRALQAAGYTSGRYTSPHLVRLEERFAVCGRAVDHETMAAAIADVLARIDQLIHDGTLATWPTFFEVTTAVAFELFHRAQVEVAVLEVGLGGRLDATNIVVPEVSAITSIAFDHQRYLGTTLREIATEKAGIIKPGVPVVVGEMEDEALAAIAGIARERGADLVQTSRSDVAHVRIGLRGRHQEANAAVAAGILRVLSTKGLVVPSAAIATGIAEATWPGRLDLRRLPDGRELLLDAAHNPAGAAALASYLHEHMPPVPLVFAAMRDKDIAGMLRALAGAVDRVVVTRASSPRSAELSLLFNEALLAMPDIDVTAEADLGRALDAAWASSRQIVVAGSIFLLGDVMESFGWSW